MEEQPDEFTIIYCDKRPTMTMKNNSFHHEEINHILIKYHFIKEV